MERLTILYDADCAVCLRCRAWMEGQPAYVALEFLGARSPEARRRYGAVPWLGEELVVVADDGSVWVGPAAFLVCLWALVEWREWSYRLSGPALVPLASRFFQLLSARRQRLAVWLAGETCEGGRCGAAPYR
jgi:predicted DCC family thiol-disulfide oxidoreductase YuxK